MQSTRSQEKERECVGRRRRSRSKEKERLISFKVNYAANRVDCPDDVIQCLPVGSSQRRTMKVYHGRCTRQVKIHAPMAETRLFHEFHSLMGESSGGGSSSHRTREPQMGKSNQITAVRYYMPSSRRREGGGEGFLTESDWAPSSPLPAKIDSVPDANRFVISYEGELMGFTVGPSPRPLFLLHPKPPTDPN